MLVRSSESKGVAVVSLRGRIDELASEALDAALQPLVAAGRRQLVLDLSEVEYIGVGGLRALVGVYRELRRQQGGLRLCGLSPFVAEVLEVSRVAAMIDVHSTRDAAVAAFAAPAA